MKILSPKVHGILDYVVVVAFALAPTLFHFSQLPAVISYALAVIHLLLTLTTAFPLGVVKWIPFTIHGSLELIVSVALVVLPWVAGFAGEAAARLYFVSSGVVIFVVWLLTDYKAARV